MFQLKRFDQNHDVSITMIFKFSSKFAFKVALIVFECKVNLILCT